MMKKRTFPSSRPAIRWSRPWSIVHCRISFAFDGSHGSDCVCVCERERERERERTIYKENPATPPNPISYSSIIQKSFSPYCSQWNRVNLCTRFDSDTPLSPFALYKWYFQILRTWDNRFRCLRTEDRTRRAQKLFSTIFFRTSKLETSYDQRIDDFCSNRYSNTRNSPMSWTTMTFSSLSTRSLHWEVQAREVWFPEIPTYILVQ